METSNTEIRPQRSWRVTKQIGYLLILILCVGVGAIGMYIISTKTSKSTSNSNREASNKMQAEKDVTSLLKEVSSFMVLPEEVPTVATITDAEKVSAQPFFKNAMNGDRVIIFANAKKAILYRPSEKKIIDVGAINVNSNKPEEAESIPIESTESGKTEE